MGMRIIFTFFIVMVLGLGNSIAQSNTFSDTLLRKFGHYTEIGALATTRTTPDNVTTAAFSFQMVNGYRFSRRLFAGMGIGADLFATETIIPLFASFRGDILKKGEFIPYYFIDFGYGFNATRNDDIEYKGGIAAAGGIGFKINLIHNKGFLVSFGYRFQQASLVRDNIFENRDYNRLALRAGFYL